MKCGDKHYFSKDKRKCYCGKADVYWFSCPRCKKNNVSKIHGIVCADCISDPKYEKEVEEESRKLSHVKIKHYGKYKEVVAFGHDKKTGQPIAIDRTGKRVDPGRTRYNLNQDPHGWKATGKNPVGRDRYNRKILG